MAKQSNYNLHFISIGLLTLFLIIIAVFTYTLSVQVQDERKNYLIDKTIASYSLSKLEFCINNSIKPCDDSTIENWNQTNTDAKFTLKSFNVLVEEGIDVYNSERE